MEASTSDGGGAAVREQGADGAELGSCAVCLSWCDRRDVGARPLVRCCKCRQPMHLDCYSSQAGMGVGRDRPAYCPEHEPLAVLDKRRAENDSSRQVRLRATTSELSSMSDSDDDGLDVFSLTVPKGARSSTASRRRPRVPLSVHPALPPLALEPVLMACQPDPLTCRKVDMVKADSFGLDMAGEAGSNHSSPSHAVCSPLHVRQHRSSQSETESVSDHDQTPPSSTARSTFSDASDMCEEESLHYKSAPTPDKHAFQALSSCAADSRAALCHRQAVTC